MDEVLAIRESARRIHDVADIVSDKYELHRGLMEIMRFISKENFHKRYIHNLAYLVQGMEYALKGIQEHLVTNTTHKGRTLDRSWFSRLISMFGIFTIYYLKLNKFCLLRYTIFFSLFFSFKIFSHT